MTSHAALASLRRLPERIKGLPESLPDADSRRLLAPLTWCFGRTMYREGHGSREVIAGEPDLLWWVRRYFPALRCLRRPDGTASIDGDSAGAAGVDRRNGFHG